MKRPRAVGPAGASNDLDGIAQPGVPLRSASPEVFEAAEHIEVPLGWKRKPGECLVSAGVPTVVVNGAQAAR